MKKHVLVDITAAKKMVEEESKKISQKKMANSHMNFKYEIYLSR